MTQEDSSAAPTGEVVTPHREPPPPLTCCCWPACGTPRPSWTSSGCCTGWRGPTGPSPPAWWGQGSPCPRWCHNTAVASSPPVGSPERERERERGGLQTAFLHQEVILNRPPPFTIVYCLGVQQITKLRVRIGSRFLSHGSDNFRINNKKIFLRK